MALNGINPLGGGSFFPGVLGMPGIAPGGCCGPDGGGFAGGVDPRSAQMYGPVQMMNMLMGFMMGMMMGQMMSQMMQGGFPGAGMGQGFPGVGGLGGGIPGGMPGFGGGMPGFGGGMPGYGGGMPGYGGGVPSYGGPGSNNNTCPVSYGPGAGVGGQAAVDTARRFLGRDSQSIRGQMPHFTAAGGQTNNCADFVCSALQSSGRIRGHFVGVRALEQALKQQGWRQIPASQARPGDVWINHQRGHTELVSEAGGRRTIGSNNDRPGHQVISERAKNPSSGVYYTKG